MIDKPPAKILIVTDAWHPQINGVVRTLGYTRDFLIQKGYEVVMLTPQQFRTIPCPTYPEIRLSLFPASKIADIISTERPDVLHISTEGPLGLAARNYACRHGLSYTTAYHTRFPEYIASRMRIPLSWTYRFLRWFHDRSHLVLVPTKAVQNDLEQWHVGTPVIWPRGVDLSIFKPDLSRKKNKRPIYLNVGRVAVEKNLEAFLSLPLDGEKWVVGDGPDLARLKKAYPDVVFWGAKTKEELPAFYNKADLFVFPSRTDTFGLVLLEAMACGLPVAAYPVTGPIDVIGTDQRKGQPKGGVLNEDLQIACTGALKLKRETVRSFAETFSWQAATDIFEDYLIQCRTDDSYTFIDNPHKHNKGIARATKAAKNSLSGFVFATKEESAFRQELLLAAPLILLDLWMPVGLFETIFLISTVVFVLITELLNSSIEAAIDRISFEHHGLSKRAKDYGSAAVFLALGVSLISHILILSSLL